MIRTILIDDEPLARSIVREYLQAYSDFEIIDECSNGYEGIKAIHQHKPDLIFLDVQMPKITGFEMLELLDDMPHVIFTTAYDEYAMKAFESMATDYLLKPFSKERFDKAITKLRGLKQNNHSVALSSIDLGKIRVRQPEEESRIVVREGGNIRIIPATDIFAIEAYDDYVKIFTRDEYFLKKKTLSYFEEVLPSTEFIRTHRSHLIQIKYIARIESYEKNNHVVLLTNERKVPLSRSGYVKLKEMLGI
ncbi:MAG: response regulator [Crocinitomicaceae bacterium]|nr:response regulator [Crocinitomicaceae bacterium]